MLLYTLDKGMLPQQTEIIGTTLYNVMASTAKMEMPITLR